MSATMISLSARRNFHRGLWDGMAGGGEMYPICGFTSVPFLLMRFGNFTHTSLNRGPTWKKQGLSCRKRQSSPSGNIKSPRLVQAWFRQKVLLRKRRSTVWQSRGGTLFLFLTVVKTHLFSCLRDTNNAPIRAENRPTSRCTRTAAMRLNILDAPRESNTGFAACVRCQRRSLTLLLGCIYSSLKVLKSRP